MDRQKQEKKQKKPSGIDHKTIFRLFKLIQNLGQRGLTIGQIQTLCDISRSTAYKYVAIIKDIGYTIENVGGVHRLVMSSDSQYGHLAEAECQLIHDALHHFAPDNPLKHQVLDKIGGSRDILPSLARELGRQQEAANMALLQQALRLKKRVILRGYQSTNAQRLSDRLFEPKFFYPDYQKVIGIEVDARLQTGLTKTFNLERIGTVTLLDDTQSFEMDTQVEKQDVFGWSGIEERAVTLRLTKRAKLILEKDFPAARRFVSDDGGGRYLLRTSYTGLESVSRFIFGLPGEIEVLGDRNLQEHLAKQWALYTLSALTGRTPLSDASGDEKTSYS